MTGLVSLLTRHPDVSVRLRGGPTGVVAVVALADAPAQFVVADLPGKPDDGRAIEHEWILTAAVIHAIDQLRALVGTPAAARLVEAG